MAHLPWPPAPDRDGPYEAGGVWLVSAVNDLSIRSGPGTEHPVVGSLDAGDLALGTELWQVPDTWIPILADGSTGFAYSGPDDDRYLVPTVTPWKAYASRLVGVVSNGSTYVAFGPSLRANYCCHTRVAGRHPPGDPATA